MFINSVFKRYSTYIFLIILGSYIGTASAMEEKDSDHSQHHTGRVFDSIELWNEKLEKKQQHNLELDAQYELACKELATVEESIRLKVTKAVENQEQMEQLKSLKESVWRQLESLSQLVAQKEEELDKINSLLNDLIVKEWTARAELDCLEEPLRQKEERIKKIQEQKKLNNEKISGFQLIVSRLRQGNQLQEQKEMIPVEGGVLPLTPSNDRFNIPTSLLGKRKVMEQPKPEPVCCDLTEETDDEETTSATPPQEKNRCNEGNAAIPEKTPVDLPPTYSYPLSDLAIQMRLEKLSFFVPQIKRRGKTQLTIENYRDFVIRYLRGEGSDDIQKTMGMKKRRYYDMVDRLKGFRVILEIDIAERHRHLLSKRN